MLAAAVVEVSTAAGGALTLGGVEAAPMGVPTATPAAAGLAVIPLGMPVMPAAAAAAIAAAAAGPFVDSGEAEAAGISMWNHYVEFILKKKLGLLNSTANIDCRCGVGSSVYTISNDAASMNNTLGLKN